MKLAVIALMCAAAALAGADAAGRGLRTETSDSDPVTVTEAELRDDDLGANEDLWGSWENYYSVHADPRGTFEPCANSGSAHSGSGDEPGPSVGDNEIAAMDGLLQKAESVATAVIPFSIEHAESSLLLVGLVVAALVVVAVAAVLVGVRRQQLSEPLFGPVELVSDLPEPMTTSAGSEAGYDEDGDFAVDSGDEADTGATILVAEEQEEEKEEVELVEALA
jgi:hypothetical protein